MLLACVAEEAITKRSEARGDGRRRIPASGGTARVFTFSSHFQWTEPVWCGQRFVLRIFFFFYIPSLPFHVFHDHDVRGHGRRCLVAGFAVQSLLGDVSVSLRRRRGNRFECYHFTVIGSNQESPERERKMKVFSERRIVNNKTLAACLQDQKSGPKTGVSSVGPHATGVCSALSGATNCQKNVNSIRKHYSSSSSSTSSSSTGPETRGLLPAVVPWMPVS